MFFAVKLFFKEKFGQKLGCILYMGKYGIQFIIIIIT